MRLDGDEEGGGGWCVTSEAGLTLRAKAVVFAPGAWLTPLARRLFGLEIPTTVTAAVYHSCRRHHRRLSCPSMSLLLPFPSP